MSVSSETYFSAEIMSENWLFVLPSSRWSRDFSGPSEYWVLMSAMSKNSDCDKMRVEWLRNLCRSVRGLTNATRWTACRPREAPRSGSWSCRRGRLRGPALDFAARSPSSASGAAFPEAGQGMIGSARRSRACGLGECRGSHHGGARCRSEPSGFSAASLELSAPPRRRGWWQHR